MIPLQSVVKPEVHEVVMDELHGIVVICVRSTTCFRDIQHCVEERDIIVHDVVDAEAARCGPKVSVQF